MPDEMADQRRAAQIRREVEAFENDPQRRAQKVIDTWWERKKADEAEDDLYDDSTGFRELRHRTSCHVGKGDPDYGKR
jgi:hypothetical protein